MLLIIVKELLYELLCCENSLRHQQQKPVQKQDGWMLGSEEQVIPEMNNNFNHCQDTSYLANFLLSVAY